MMDRNESFSRLTKRIPDATQSVKKPPLHFSISIVDLNIIHVPKNLNPK